VDGIQFRLHDRLAKLSNRIDGETLAKLLAAIHAGVPMVTPDEHRALQLENAKADDRLWSSLRDMHQEKADGHKGLIATAQTAVTMSEAETAKVDSNAENT
jgi:hypothetical protein